MAKRNIPYGSWPGRISGRDVAGAALRLAQPRRFGDATWWLETRPHEKGRCVLVCATDDGVVADAIPAPFSAQSRVNEYGGGAYTVHDGQVFFVNKSDQDVWRKSGSDTQPQRITDDPRLKFADLVHDPRRNRLFAICERAGDPPSHSLVAIDIGSGKITTLASGEDFYSSPLPSADGSEIAWLSWSHPNMPWDGTCLWRAPLADDGIGAKSLVAGGDQESIFQPGWLPDGRLAWVSDASNWWNLHVEDAGGSRPLHSAEAEFGLPQWVFGMRTWSPLDGRRIACAWTRDGRWQAGLLDIDEGSMEPLELPVDSIDTIDAGDGHIVLMGGSATRFNSIYHHDGEQLVQLQQAATTELDDEYFSRPEAISFETADGEIAYGFHYPPTNPDVETPAGSPPLLVKCHGGPTAATTPVLDMKIQYWTSRGFAVLDVNYRGSTGYGRQFRRALYGNWGRSDVEDCIHGALSLANAGKADRQRLLISGSSAGGYTVLNALTFHDVFAAGASYYGVADPVSAMRDTEKFESRYGDRLIGPLPQTLPTWEARSPLLHADKLRRPVIFLQGLDDPVVLPDQSERMMQALRDNGVATAYLEFAGEGHGFRQAATIEKALDSEYAFYCRVLGLQPGNKLPPLQIDNLD